MARKTNDRLTEELSRCTHDLMEIASDPEWSGQNPVIIRKAVPVFLRQVAESARWIVLIHFAPTFGNPNLEIFRRPLNLREPGILLRARWSPTEALFVLAEEPTRFLDKIIPILNNEQISFTVGFTTYSGSINHDYDRAVKELTAVRSPS